MNDIRRTILWVIFGFSMVLLWDQWQVYNGHKATFFASPSKTVAAPPAAATSSVPTGVPVASTVVSTTPVPGPVATVAIAPAAARERVVVTTDVFKATFDTEGGSLVRTELLKHLDKADKTKAFVLLDDRKDHTYTAQTGLIAGAV